MTEEKKTWGGKRDNSGRHSVYKDKTKVSLYLTKEAVVRLSDLAKELGISKSDMAIKFIMEDAPDDKK